jgi:hypothetical protein
LGVGGSSNGARKTTIKSYLPIAAGAADWRKLHIFGVSFGGFVRELDATKVVC